MIRGRLDRPGPGRLQPKLAAVLFVPALLAPPAFLAVEFTVDTGAEMTVINAESIAKMPGYDATLTRAKLVALPQRPLQGIGGLVSFAETQAIFAFPQHDGTPRVLIETVMLTYPSAQPAAEPLLSLLGCNVLQHFTLRMFGPAGDVVLE